MHYISLLVWERSQLKQLVYIISNISIVASHLLEVI